MDHITEIAKDFAFDLLDFFELMFDFLYLKEFVDGFLEPKDFDIKHKQMCVVTSSKEAKLY